MAAPAKTLRRNTRRSAVHKLVVLGVLVGMSSAALAEPEIDRTKLRKELAARRDLNLKRFHVYRLARVYPHNTYQAGFLNVWRDNEHNLCAVANLVAKDGRNDLVDKTEDENNNIRLADVTTGQLMDWVLTSGFTQEELVMIQYPNFAQDDPIGYARMIRRQREEERARKREDQRLASGYLATERALKQRVLRDAALDLAVARLARRPDLVAQLHEQTKTLVATE
jgi:hypothetical protein